MQEVLRVAAFRDEYVDGWLNGADPTDGPLREWFAACQGGAEVVARDGLPEPYGGDLRGSVSSPRLVVLAQHAGEYEPRFQSREGV
jgi:hypothetical protein